MIRPLLDLLDVPDLDGALCAEIGGDWWHPDMGQESRTAKSVCAKCPVQAECLEWALRTNEPYGVWGGFTTVERRQLRRKRAS